MWQANTVSQTTLLVFFLFLFILRNKKNQTKQTKNMHPELYNQCSKYK